MLIGENMTSSTARIEVQQRFCDTCCSCIKKELQVTKGLDNVRLYPKESLITFNFNDANKLSTALNILSKIGYSEKGDKIKTKTKSACQC